MLTWQERVFERINVQILLFEKQASRTNYTPRVMLHLQIPLL